MNEMLFVAGLHCTDKKTTVFIADRDGKIVGTGTSGPSDYATVSKSSAATAIRSAVKQAEKKARVRRLRTIVAAFPEMDSAQEWKAAAKLLRSLNLADVIVPIHELTATLYAATARKMGVTVIVDTDSVTAIGLNRKGDRAKVGGWGYPIEDDGSPFNVGRKALNMAFRSFDGREKHTKLVGALKQRFRVKSFDDIVNQVYTKGMTHEDVAELTSVVSKIAARDQISRRILEAAGTALGQLTCDVARQLGMLREDFDVTITRTTLTLNRLVMRSFKTRILQQCPKAHIIRVSPEIATGCLYIALKLPHVTAESVV